MFLSFSCTCLISPLSERLRTVVNKSCGMGVEDETLDEQMLHVMHMIRDQGGVEPPPLSLIYQGLCSFDPPSFRDKALAPYKNKARKILLLYIPHVYSVFLQSSYVQVLSLSLGLLEIEQRYTKISWICCPRLPCSQSICAASKSSQKMTRLCNLAAAHPD